MKVKIGVVQPKGFFGKEAEQQPEEAECVECGNPEIKYKCPECDAEYCDTCGRNHGQCTLCAPQLIEK